MSIWDVVIQGLGWGSTIIFLWSDLQEDDSKLDRYYTLGNLLFFFHLALLQAWIPAGTVLLAVLRNTLNRHYRSHRLKQAFIALFSLIFIVTVTTEPHWQLALPAFVSVMMTVAFMYGKKHTLTLASIISSILWIVLGSHLQSLPIIALETLSITFLCYRTYRIVQRDRTAA